MVTFRTSSHGNIPMLDRDARTMLKLMGVSTTVPSALKAEDVPAARQRLKQAIENHDTPPPEPTPADAANDDDDEEPPVALKTRALPLLDLLAAAENANDYVIWE